MKVYFDNAATTPLRPEVIESFTHTLGVFGNASSTHSFGREAKSLLEQARRQIARVFSVQSAEIFFTSGGTEGINMLIHQSIENLGVQHIISSSMEHHAVLHSLERVQKKGVQVHYVRITSDGLVDVAHLETLLSSINGTKLVSLMHVNNETGIILPLKQVAELCKAYGAYFHSDTVQSVGHIELNLAEIPVDFITASAHKFHAPKGVGFVFIRKGIKLKAFINGGEQERGLRAGTEALHQIVAMQKALEISVERMSQEQQQLLELKKYLVNKLTVSINSITFNGQSANYALSSNHILNVSLPLSTEKTNIILLYLDMQGIALSRGSACASGSVSPSHALAAFLPQNKLLLPNLRISISVFNTPAEIDYLVEKLKFFCEQ